MPYTFDLEDYNYPLDAELIAQHPVPNRDASKLLALDRRTGSLTDCSFRDILNYLSPGDCLVVNDSRVFPARIFGKKETGGKIELFLLHFPKEISPGMAEVQCLFRASKAPKIGMKILCHSYLYAVVEDISGGEISVKLFYKDDLNSVLDAVAKTPLPPYIRREEDKTDRVSYQTVYARRPGSVAAPTAGLHFTHDLLKNIEDHGVSIVSVTLHVGYGTFAPIRSDDIRSHKIHSEWLTIEKHTADVINQTKNNGNRVIAVGTTSVRALEFSNNDGKVICCNGMCDLYIVPGHKFKLVDAMITNFHLPKSSLLVLVSAFAGRETILNAYDYAMKHGYRFYSYGDAMFIY